MSLITRCPACATTFKVVPDQLRISEGWVRCGQCTEVFDAQAHLVDEASGASPGRSAATPDPQVQPPLFLRTPAAPLSPTRSVTPPAVPFTTDLAVDPVPEPPAPLPVGGPAPSLESAQVSGPLGAPRALADELAEQLARLDLSVTRPAPAPKAPESAPPPPTVALTPEPLAPPVGVPDLVLPTLSPKPAETPPSAAEQEAAEAIDLALHLDLPPHPVGRVEPTLDTAPLPLGGTLASAPVASVPQAEPVALNPAVGTEALEPDADWSTHWAAERARLVEEVPPAMGLPPEAAEVEAPADRELQDLAFLQQARQRAFWRRPLVRGGLGLLSLLLAAWLGAQWLVHERDWIVAAQPAWRPVVQELCSALGCQLRPWRHIEAVQIESSAFNKAKGEAAYQFALSLKNTAALQVAMPSAELTLTDAQDQAVLRRVFSVAELGAPAQLTPGQEWSVSLPVSLAGGNALRIAGYRVLVFYP